MVDMGTENAKTRKVGEYKKLDEALYIWFRQQRDKNIPVSGPLLLEKARILFVKLYGDSDKQFTGSTVVYCNIQHPVFVFLVVYLAVTVVLQ